MPGSSLRGTNDNSRICGAVCRPHIGNFLLVPHDETRAHRRWCIGVWGGFVITGIKCRRALDEACLVRVLIHRLMLCRRYWPRRGVLLGARELEMTYDAMGRGMKSGVCLCCYVKFFYCNR